MTTRRRVIAIAIAIVAVLLLGWQFIYPGDLSFSPPVPR
jgi:hypothetical protein